MLSIRYCSDSRHSRPSDSLKIAVVIELFHISRHERYVCHAAVWDSARDQTIPSRIRNLRTTHNETSEKTKFYISMNDCKWNVTRFPFPTNASMAHAVDDDRVGEGLTRDREKARQCGRMGETLKRWKVDTICYLTSCMDYGQWILTGFSISRYAQIVSVKLLPRPAHGISGARAA